jgi:16S rRNA (guanine1516-N2)-methyltransferase
MLLCEESIYGDKAISQRVDDICVRLQAQLVHSVNWRDKNLPDFVLVYSSAGLELQMTGKKAPGPIAANFATGGVDHRRKFGGGKGQMIAKAVGLKNISSTMRPLRVLDATAGLGRDAFVLATLGCDMTLLERADVVWEILNSGLIHARVHGDIELQSIMAQVRLHKQDSRQYLESLTDSKLKPDVVYLDPMFPSRTKSASVKKEMAIFHSLVGADDDANELLQPAIAAAQYRVAVKRPLTAPFLAELKPTYQLLGKTGRYDIYVNKKLDLTAQE